MATMTAEIAPAPSVEPAKPDRWLLPLCLLATVLWGLFIACCWYVWPEYVDLFVRLKQQPPEVTVMVLGLRHPYALALVALAALGFAAGAHLLRNRQAAVALVALALLALAGGLAAVHLPYAYYRDNLVRGETRKQP